MLKDFSKIIVFCCLGYFFSSNLSSTTLPESYPLKNASSEPNPIDKDLEKWLAEYVLITSPLYLDQKAFTNFVSTLDEVTRAYLELLYANAGKGNHKDAAEQAVQLVKQTIESNPNVPAHPLLPYLLDEILQSGSVPDDFTKYAATFLSESGAKSCPQRELILRDLNEKLKNLSDKDSSIKLINQIASYKSSKFREEAFEAFIDALGDENRLELKQYLYPHVKDFSKILEDNTWLSDEAEKLEEIPQQEMSPKKRFELVTKQAKKGQCNNAQSQFSLVLNEVENQDPQAADAGDRLQEDAQSSAIAIDTCMRRYGPKVRLKLWRTLLTPLEKSYGFVGKELSLRRQGLLYWAEDQFKEARKIFEDIYREAVEQKHERIEQNAVYTLARIQENENLIPQAIESYETYLTKFPAAEYRDFAMTSLVLLYTMTEQYKKALEHIDFIIQRESKKLSDETEQSMLAFALFWGGRIHLALGNFEIGKELWRRLASEYYSSFYGAVGHYMLEKVTGADFRLEPSRSIKFSRDKLSSSFEYEDQLTVKRIEALLKIGLKDQASCELSELALKPDNNNYNRVLYKSLLLYAAGEWLKAIKVFDTLPRSFRHNLPIGIERILFPKAYEEKVKQYAGKLKIDPDFILAIVRQESVFNPRARSSAGARGLMQLMPRTARVEARNLNAHYLPVSAKRKLKDQTRSKTSLYDIDANLAIGVHHIYRLLRKYNNPVHVLTAYNANPAATKRWIENIATDDFLIFIERIPYRETKVYVKLVLRNYFYYKRWYGGPQLKLSHLDLVIKKAMTIAQTPEIKREQLSQ